MATIQGELTTTCTCYRCEGCEVGYDNVPYNYLCDECGVEVIPTTDCWGDCWDYARNDLVTTVQGWMDTFTDTDYYFIRATGMGWMREDAESAHTDTADGLVAMLGINGDYILRWAYNFDEETFTVVRSSHDEMGAKFEFLPYKEEEEE